MKRMICYHGNGLFYKYIFFVHCTKWAKANTCRVHLLSQKCVPIYVPPFIVCWVIFHCLPSYKTKIIFCDCICRWIHRNIYNFKKLFCFCMGLSLIAHETNTIPKSPYRICIWNVDTTVTYTKLIWQNITELIYKTHSQFCKSVRFTKFQKLM